MINDLQTAAENACTEIGIIFRPVPTDGKFHQLDVEGKATRNGAGRIRLYSDNEGGQVWNHVTGDTLQFWAKSLQTLAPAEVEERKRRAKVEREKAERELAEARQKAAKLAVYVWKVSQPPIDSLYWQRKQVEPTDTIREIPLESLVNLIGYHPKVKWKPFSGERVQIIPVRGDKGISTIEMIDETGLKAGLTDGQKKGCFWATEKLPGGDGAMLTIIMGEGVATVLSGVKAVPGSIGIAALSCGNLKAIAAYFRRRFPQAKIVILSDLGNGEQNAVEAACSINALIVKPTMKEGSTGSDINDVHCEISLDEARRQIEAAAPPENPAAGPSAPTNAPTETTSEQVAENDASESALGKEKSRITVVTVFDLMAREFPPRENLLSPWLPKQGLTMVYAPRGIGKTHFSLGVAYAVTSGGEFLGWKAPRAASVLFVDGEMPAVTLQERIARINMSSTKEPEAPFQIITPDLQNPETGMIDLSRPADQRELERYLDGVELIIIDNLSTLCRTGKESEGEGWLPVQEWTLKQRAAGRSVLLVHHSGKNGEQRGTSRREDVLDTVISLKRPPDYSPDKGAVFEVHFEKSRGMYGDKAKPFEAQLTTDTVTGLQAWTVKSLEKSTAEKVASLLEEGHSQHEIAEILGMTKGAISKARKKAEQMGLIVPK